ncbi:MAG: hypothetical protein EPN25_10170 [Nitrospirae bacterium]|nr:MAG: hypothetical protein EPN25_10170 [Nitrospirota bacterium]
MTRLLCVLIFVLIPFAGLCFSQNIRATTEDGRVVTLKKDGTWQFLKKSSSSVPNTRGAYQKSDSATAVYKAKNDKIAIWYDPSKWHQKKSDNSSKPLFEHKDGDVDVMFLAERFAMDIDALKEMAITNAQAAAPDTKVTYEEKRLVNGKNILCMKMEGTIQTIHFIYYGYYYSGKEGTVQLLAYTSNNLFPEYESDLTEFLNGLVIN